MERDHLLSKVLYHTHNRWPSIMPTNFKTFYQRINQLAVKERYLLGGTKVVIPEEFQPTILACQSSWYRVDEGFSESTCTVARGELRH